jgi:xanthine dehydrogenase YagS FAD-binding subunit
MAVALVALDARIVVRGAQRERTIPISAFYRLPGDTPAIENDLKPGELITAVDVPAQPAQRLALSRGPRRELIRIRAGVPRQRSVDMGDDHRIRGTRIALGGASHRPWRIPAADEALRGREAAESAFREAPEILVAGRSRIAITA